MTDNLYDIFNVISEDINAIIDAYSQNIRRIKTRATFGAFSGENFVQVGPAEQQFKNLVITQETDPVPINCAASQTVDMTIINPAYGVSHWSSNAVRIEVGIKCDASSADEDGYVWVALGTFLIKERRTDDNGMTYTIKGSDQISLLDDKKITGTYLSAQTVGSLFPEIYFKNPNAYPATEYVDAVDIEKLKRYTKREALGYIAGHYGCFARTDCNGLVEFTAPFFTSNASGNKFNFKAEEESVTVYNITAGTKQTNTMYPDIIHLGSTQYCVSTPLSDISYIAENTYNTITSAMPEVSYTDQTTGTLHVLKSEGEYDVGELETNGTVFWVLGSVISFTDAYGNYKRVWIARNEINLSGGMSMNITSKAMETDFTIDESDLDATIEDVQSALQESKDYTDTSSSNAVTQANNYTDSHAATPSDVSSAVSTGVTSAVSQANTYTDQKIAELNAEQYKSPNILDKYTSSQAYRERTTSTDAITTPNSTWAYQGGTKYKYTYRPGQGINGKRVCFSLSITVNAAANDAIYFLFETKEPKYAYASVNVPSTQSSEPKTINVYYVYDHTWPATGTYLNDITMYIYTRDHGGDNGTSIEDLTVTMSNEYMFYTDQAEGIYTTERLARGESNFAQLYTPSRYPGEMPAVTKGLKYDTAVFNGEMLVLRDNDTEAAMNAEALKQMLEVIKYQRKVIDIPIYNRTDGLLVPGTPNTAFVSPFGIGHINQMSYSNAFCISGLNLMGVKQLRIIYRRDDSSSGGLNADNSAFGEFTIPLEYPMTMHNGNDVLGEWFATGSQTNSHRNDNRSINVMASVWYPTGGSLASCNFTFNRAWSLYGTGVTSVSNCYIVAIYACY